MIGIFDSGLGGLTVARAIMRRLPGEPLVYFGDTARTPYGNKSKQVIEGYTLQNIKFLLSRGVDRIVMACNTASALAFPVAKKHFPLVPIFEVITPAVDEASRFTESGRIGIIGTRATVQSGVYEKRLTRRDARFKIFSQACPLFVPLIEEGWLRSTQMKSVAREYLEPLLARNIDTLILGCTHYPLIKGLLQSIVGEGVRLVDAADAMAQKLADGTALSEKSGVRHQWYASDITPYFHAIASRWLGKKINVKRQSVF